MKQGKATVQRRPRYSKRFLTTLWNDCVALGITGQEIAVAAAVKSPTVYNVQAGRRMSAAVIEAAIRLRDEKVRAA